MIYCYCGDLCHYDNIISTKNIRRDEIIFLKMFVCTTNSAILIRHLQHVTYSFNHWESL